MAWGPKKKAPVKKKAPAKKAAPKSTPKAGSVQRIGGIRVRDLVVFPNSSVRGFRPVDPTNAINPKTGKREMVFAVTADGKIIFEGAKKATAPAAQASPQIGPVVPGAPVGVGPGGVNLSGVLPVGAPPAQSPNAAALNQSSTADVASGGGGTGGGGTGGGGGGADAGGSTTDSATTPATAGSVEGSASVQVGAGGEGAPLSPGEEDLVRQQFGHLAWALDIPEIANILRQAAQNEWPENKLIAAVYASQWWKTTSDSQRQWIQLSAQDPGTATQRVNAVVDQLRVESQQLGVNIPIERLKVVAESSLRFGMTTQQLTSALGSEIKFVLRDSVTGRVAFSGPGGEPGYDPGDPNRPAGGRTAVMEDGREVYYIPGQKGLGNQLEVGTAGADLQGGLGDIEREIRRIAADYLVPLSNRTLIQWLEKIAKGEMKVEDFRGYLIEQAKSLYPTIAASLDKGITTAQYLAPYAEVAAAELDINPADIDFSQEKWNRPLSQVDPKTGERTTMNLADWRLNVRSDPLYGWDNTLGANDQAASLVLNIGKTFGEAA